MPGAGVYFHAKRILAKKRISGWLALYNAAAIAVKFRTILK